MILEGPSFFPVACQVRTLVSQRNGSPKYCLIGKDSTISRGVSHEGQNSSDGASRGSRKTGFPGLGSWPGSCECSSTTMAKIRTLAGLLVLVTVGILAALKVSSGETPGSWSEP